MAAVSTGRRSTSSALGVQVGWQQGALIEASDADKADDGKLASRYWARFLS
jgi:hypothetical protein